MGTGFLGTRATLVADINLILQVVVLIVLSAGAFQARRRNFDSHRLLMTAAVIANAALIIAIMNPSFFRILPFGLRSPGARRPTVMWPHVLVGTLAELMGVYIVIRTNVEQSTASSWPGMMRVMLITLLLWLVALVGGITLYSVWYM